MDLDEVAEELYGLPPEDFIGVRTDRVKAARAAGDRGLAGEIAGLGKPTVAAWLANQLVRERPDEVRALLQLGADLREATAELHGDALRELGRQQHRLIAALVQQARKVAGRKVSEQQAQALAGTLGAALADEGAGEQLAAGRLTDALQHTGFGGEVTSTAPPRRAAANVTPIRRLHAAPGGDVAEQRKAERRARADEALADARTAAEEAEHALAEAREELDRATAEDEEAADRVSALREQLDRAVERHAETEHVRRRARVAAERADTAVKTATGKVETAQRRRDALDEED